MAEKTIRLTPAHKRQRTDRILGLIAVVTIAIAWFVGASRSGDNLLPALARAVPEAVKYNNIENSTYEAIGEDGEIIGIVSVGEAVGYGGPMDVAVAINAGGEVIGYSIVSHKETPSYLEKVLDSYFVEDLLGMDSTDQFALGEDIDGISGATYTSGAIVEAVREETRENASKYYDFTVPEESTPKILFGISEIALIVLYAVGFFGHKGKFKYKKQTRWATMIIGMIVIGFIYNRPLTISYFNQLFLGYFPVWQTNLYWYLLLGGIFFVFTVDNKNPYCSWFCPFGAAQECLGAIGGAKPRSAGKFTYFLRWVQRGLAWAAIVIALIFRNPGITSFEVFGTLFDFTGTMLQFTMLGVIVIASLYILRPWCTYLCPMGPVMELYRTFRGWVMELWRKRKTA